MMFYLGFFVGWVIGILSTLLFLYLIRRKTESVADGKRGMRQERNLIQDDKDADGFGVDIHPGIMCGKCGRKYRTKDDEKSPLDFFNGKVLDFRKISKRRLKIRNSRKMMEKDDG